MSDKPLRAEPVCLSLSHFASRKGDTCLLCRNLRLRAFRRVEIVLSKSVLRFFKP